MKVFLHQHITAAGERHILDVHQRGVDRRLTHWVLRSVDKADEITIIEIFEPMHFVDGRDRVPEARHDLLRQFKTQVHALRTDMKKEIARRGDRMPRASPDLAERMQFGRPRRTE